MAGMREEQGGRHHPEAPRSPHSRHCIDYIDCRTRLHLLMLWKESSYSSILRSSHSARSCTRLPTWSAPSSTFNLPAPAPEPEPARCSFPVHVAVSSSYSALTMPGIKLIIRSELGLGHWPCAPCAPLVLVVDTGSDISLAGVRGFRLLDLFHQ